MTDQPKTSLPYVGELLRQAADLFEERNRVYGNNFEMVGEIMEAMFPDGVTLRTAADHNRFHLFMLKIVKLSRYAVNYEDGGHEDSLDDDIVYTAMVAAMDRRAGHR